MAAIAGGVSGCGVESNPIAAPPAEPIVTTAATPGASGVAGAAPAEGASASAEVPGTASAAAVDDPPGTVTCAQLGRALRDGSLMTAGVVDGIEQAAATADAPIADAADRLGKAYDAAVAASGKSGEPDAVAKVSARASDMSDVCADSGLQTAG
jgi:hypothetical protein